MQIRVFSLDERKQWLAAAGGILLLGLVLRCWGLAAESAWVDEAYSITLARYPLVSILQGAAADQHPPLYYLLLHVWLKAGSGVAFSRLLSLILGVVHIGQVLSFARILAGERVAFLTGLLLAVSPLHILYSQEARMYILLAVLTTAATISFWRSLRKEGCWGFYILWATLALYTHYFTAFVLFFHGLWALSHAFSRRELGSFFKWGISGMFSGAVFLPWLPVALDQVRYHTLAWLEPPAAVDVRDAVLRILAGSGVLVAPDGLRWLGWVALFALCIAGGYQIIRRPGERLAFLFVTTWGLAPFLTISGIALFYPIFQLKQFLIVLAPLLLTVSWISRSLPRVWGMLFYLILLGGASAFLVYQQVTPTKNDWRGAYAYLAQYAAPGDMIFSNPKAGLLALSLYGELPVTVEGYPVDYDILSGGWQGEPLTPELADEVMSEATLGKRRVWLVEDFPEMWDAQYTLENWLSGRASLELDLDFNRVRIRLYSLSDSQP